MSRTTSPVGQLQTAFAATEGAALVAFGMQRQLRGILELVEATAALAATVGRAWISRNSNGRYNYLRHSHIHTQRYAKVLEGHRLQFDWNSWRRG